MKSASLDWKATTDAIPSAHLRGKEGLSGYTWYVIILLAVVNVFNYMDRMALAVLAPYIKSDLQLSDGQVGLLVGFAFSVCYAICGIPIARWADHGVRKNIIALAVATWSVMTVLCGAAQNFWSLFAARIGVGVGEAGSLPPASSLICDYVPVRRRAGVFALFSFGLYAGMVLGMGLAGWLGEVIGWRWTFVALGIPGIALALVVKLTLREPARGLFDGAREVKDQLSFRATLIVLRQCKTYLMLMVFVVVNGFVQHGLNQWWPSFYTRVFGLKLSTVGAYLGLAIGIGSALGLLLGGMLADKLAQRDVRSPLLLGAGATALALPAALGSLFIPSAVGSMVLVSLTALFCSISHGPLSASSASVVMSEMRATGIALKIFVTSILGFGLGPFCVGVLSDLLTPSLGVEALRYAMLAPVCLIPVMVVALYAAARALPADLKAAGVNQ